MNRWLIAPALLLVPGLALGGGARPAEPRVTVRLDEPAGKASPWLYGASLPAPGTPGADGLLAELVRNGSFEAAPPGRHEAMPGAWGKPRGWELRSFGSRQILLRRERGSQDPVVLVRGQEWREYHLSLLARKVEGTGGLCVLFEVQDRQNHLRWTLGANGNREHVLESVGKGKPRLLAPAVVGCVEPGRCYRVDMRLKEGVLTCSLDGRLIHRVGETRFPHSGIGFGATDATAEYLDIKVLGPKGALLFLLDRPNAASVAAVSSEWSPLAEGKCTVACEWDPLLPRNGGFSQRIKVEGYSGGEAGLRQSGIAVAAGTPYRGRIALRAVGAAPVAVELRSAEGLVHARQGLGVPAEAWRDCRFTLTPKASDPAAELRITVGGNATVWVDAVSLMPGTAADGHGLRSGVAAMLREVRPSLLRWPAGPAAEDYNWRDGIGPLEERPVASVAGGSEGAFRPAPNDFGTDEFLALCGELGAEPLLVANPHLGMRPALCWLEYCNGDAAATYGKLRAANGHDKPYGVRLWAIGGDPPPDAGQEAYAATVATIAKAMREQDPTVRIVAFGGSLWSKPDADAALLKEAGPLLSHVAAPFAMPAAATWAPTRSELPFGPGPVRAKAQALRTHSLSVALTDWSANDSPAAAAGLLAWMAAEAGPEAIATCRWTNAADLGKAPELLVLKLLRSVPLGEPVRVEVEGEEPCDAVAGRDGDKVVVWVAAGGTSDARASLELKGLGRRGLAPKALHLAIGRGADGRSAELRRGELAVQGAAVSVLLSREEPVHVVVLQLKEQ